jgi:hypothetical protein
MHMAGRATANRIAAVVADVNAQMFGVIRVNKTGAFVSDHHRMEAIRREIEPCYCRWGVYSLPDEGLNVWIARCQFRRENRRLHHRKALETAVWHRQTNNHMAEAWRNNILVWRFP